MNEMILKKCTLQIAKPTICILIFLLFSKISVAQYRQQQQNQHQLLVGFYNCENFYDTINQVNVVDEDFLPNSEKKYNQLVYETKAKRLANVIYKLGVMENVNGIALLGLAEIENKMVLTHLIESSLLKKYHYKYIHFDSKDPRGVDVALIYNPAQFTPYQYRPYTLTDETHFNTYATRDILYVKGRLNNEWVHILVNHWPSRRGGEKSSASKRIWASSICKKIMDSVHLLDTGAKFIVMGDFNDNPNNKSIQQLKMTNPFDKMYKAGIGSIAYNDAWNLFDQILVSIQWKNEPPFTGSNFSLNNYKSIIYKNELMVESTGKYAGYPKRTYNGNQFNAGYSDHFPVALIFTLKMTENPQ
jgi:endonuclease/exonuclease/phosphatase family metal-dependent hydrolase